MARNIIEVVESATPDQTNDGVRWYAEANSVALSLSKRHGITLEQAAGILAALSPRVQWGRNVRQAWTLCETGTCGTLARSRDNALRILNGAPPMDVLGGPKTRAFSVAIESGGWHGVAVVDVWAVRAATRSKYDEVSRGRYVDVAQAYAVAARRLGRTVHETQAIAWVVARGRAE
jgi:hypothetical protein